MRVGCEGEEILSNRDDPERRLQMKDRVSMRGREGGSERIKMKGRGGRLRVFIQRMEAVEEINF